MEQVRYELAAQDEKPKNEKLQRIKNVLSTIVLLVVSGSVSSVLGYFFYHLDTPGGTVFLINMRIRFLPNRHLEWRDQNGRTLLEGHLGTTFPVKVNHDIRSKNATFMHMQWTNQAELFTDWWKTPSGVQCYRFTWRAATCIHSVLQDCYSLGRARWFGGGVHRNQTWPLNEASLAMAPFLTGYIPNHTYGPVIGRYWLSSTGIAVRVEQDTPLWVSINASGSNQICLRATYGGGAYYWQPAATTPVHLNYTMCAGAHLRAVHDYMTQTFFQFPRTPPSDRTLQLLNRPVWYFPLCGATGGQALTYFSTAEVLAAAAEFVSFTKNVTSSRLMLDLTCVDLSARGGGRFNRSHGGNNQPNDVLLPAMMKSGRDLLVKLQGMGFDVSLVVNPKDYISRRLRKDYVRQVVFADSEPESLPPRIRWETTATELRRATSDWFSRVIDQQRSHLGVSSFVFRGGDVMSLPFSDVIIKGLRSPEQFTANFQDMAISVDPDAVFDVMSGATNRSTFVVMATRWWSWGASSNGLAGIIPEALTLGLLGYPYLMAPPLSSDHLKNGDLEDPQRAADLRHIFLCWLQVVAFFPALTLSVSPTVFGENTTGWWSDIMEQRQAQLPLLLGAARTAHVTRQPIIRPVWWVAPTDAQAQTIDDQFLVGNLLLVAPVLSLRRGWHRNIYLPRGRWHDLLRNETILGPSWLHDYSAAGPGKVALFILESETGKANV